MARKYVVRLSSEEREALELLVKKGKTQAYRIKHANILLAVDVDGPDLSDEEAAEAFSCHVNTVANVRQRFVEQELEAAWERKKQKSPSRERILAGEKEARLIALACIAPPDGRSKWTLQLLTDKLVALKVVESISDQTVRGTLKKTNSSLTCASAG